MRILPIIFQPEMVRALLAGRKTQTRRLAWSEKGPTEKNGVKYTGYKRLSPLAHVKAGDVLYVRESYRFERLYDEKKPSEVLDGAFVFYEATPETYPGEGNAPRYSIGKLRPAIHIPRIFSRLTLAVTEVRFEPVQNISYDDAMAEGCILIQSGTYGFSRETGPRWSGPQFAYENLWQDINGEDSWAANPEVVALTFTVHRQNVDEFLRAGAANGTA